MRTRHALVAGLVAATVALIVTASVAAHPRSLADATAIGNPMLDATNALIAAPWQGLAEQTSSDAKKAIKDALEGKTFVNGSGSATYRGQNVAKWTLKVETRNISSNVDIASPPGFRQASLSRLKVEAPLDGSWNFRIAGDVALRAGVKVRGSTLFSAGTSLPFGLRIEKFRTALASTLQSPGPLDGQNVPKIAGASLSAQMTFGGSWFVPSLIPVQFTVRAVGATVEIAAPIANVPFNLGPLNARFTGALVLTVLPVQTTTAVPYPEINQGQITGMSELSVGVQQIRVALRGTLAFSLPRFGSHSTPLELGFPLVIPTTDAITKALPLLGRQLPMAWGESTPTVDSPSAPPASTPFAAEAAEIESAIVPHLLAGQVLSIDSPQNLTPLPRPGDLPRPGERKQLPPPPQLAYSVEADAANWTGHYLAAEAFRYAATSSSDALARVKTVLDGVQRLFDVTTDAVVANGEVKPVAVPGPHGFFARVAWPSTSQVDFVVDPNPSASSGPLANRACHYIDPEGGWQVLGDASRTIYPDLAGAFASLTSGGRTPRVDVPGGAAAQNGDLVPVGTIWYGWGCGTDHPLSRDAYVGIMLGLSTANRLVPDRAVQTTTKKLIEQIVDYLILHRWNVLLPPDNRIVTSSSFIGGFDKQLAFLRIAATIDPTHVSSLLTYKQRYDVAKAAAGAVWVQELAAVVDPVVQYYKFNLTHAALTPSLVYEQDPAVRAGYMAAHNLIWAKLKYHRNAYFSLLRILIQVPGQRAAAATAPSAISPGLTLGAEIRAVLAEWLQRRELVPGLHGLPRNTLGEPIGTTHEANLAPNHVALSTGLDGGRRCLAKHALPVWARSGYGMDFSWQKQPFEIAYELSVCRSAMAGTKPTAAQLLAWGHLKPDREGPGVDYLLAYWLGAYLGVLPK